MSRIFAIDLGAWSVKVAIGHAGLRHAAISEIIERPVPPGDEPHEQRAARVLAGIVREHHLEKDTGYLIVGGAQVFVHVLEFGFKTARRQDLDKLVGGELEGIVPVDLEDLVYACEPLPALPEVPVDPAAIRGRTAAPTTGTRVLSYSMPLARARQLLELTAGAGSEARGLIPVAVLAHLAGRAPSLAGPGAVAVIDVGHDHTHVVVAQGGKPVFSRTLSRGGRAVTEAIARNWRLPFGDAENAKHTDGFIASPSNPAPSEAWQRVHGVVITEVGPWARDLRQTLAACRAKTGVIATRLLLVGGGSRLRGLAPFVASELGLPVSTLVEGDAAALVGAKLGSSAIDTGALAVAAAHDLGGGRPSLDLRQGPLAFKVDMSFVKAKIAQVAIAAMVVLAFAGASAYASLRNLRKADKILTERVAVESAEVFNGKTKTVAELSALSGTGELSGESPLPKMSAYDLLLQINEKMPARDKVTLDVTNLEIKEDKINFAATAKTPEEIDQIEAAFKQIPCIKDISRGQMTTGPDKMLSFSFNIRAECM